MANVIISAFIGIFLSCCGSNWHDGAVIHGSIKRDSIVENDSLTVHGSVMVRSIAVKNLTIQGSATIGPGESFVDGDMLVQGKLEARNITVNGNAKVQGSLVLDDAVIKKSLQVSREGTIAASTIDGDVMVASKKLILKSKVTIKGRIEFVKDAGEVVIDGTDIHVLGGITNGKAQKVTDSKTSEPVHF